MSISNEIKELIEQEMGVSKLYIGMITVHPETGKKIQITDGQFWGEHGISNFWYWKEIMEDGSLSETEKCGYGWL